MFTRWVVDPVHALKLLVIPLAFYVLWELVSLRPQPLGYLSNPFGQFFLISNKLSTDEPRYAKSWADLLFVSYYVVFLSCFRQVVVTLGRRFAECLGIRSKGRIVRFGEQTHAFVYFSLASAWGYRLMAELPTWWYKTEYFWIDYPHWDMKPELKSYYLIQAAYWIQQVLVLVLGMERPRKDYNQQVVHHVVTIWLISWSYLMNLTLIGHAVYLSMDISEVFFSFSKLLNYADMNRAKIVSVVIFTCVWTYFRHYLNLIMLWSLWTQFDLVPESARRWAPAEGTYLVGWVQYCLVVALGALQLLNLLWYALLLRIVVRAVMTAEADDDRSDDEDEGEAKGAEAHDDRSDDKDKGGRRENRDVKLRWRKNN
ncbi:longevity assurance proteins LAG1/LAC1 [Mycena sanguinolenta]|nr:longevity assurance proteins LAG1/LAC1 [Mycena sanguinolenta]